MASTRRRKAKTGASSVYGGISGSSVDRDNDYVWWDFCFFRMHTTLSVLTYFSNTTIMYGDTYWYLFMPLPGSVSCLFSFGRNACYYYFNNNNNLLKAYSPVKHRVTSGLFERLVQIENQNVIDPLMYCVTVLGHLYVNKSHTIFGHVLCSHLLSTTTKSSVLWMTQISQIS